jgi:hypothetical protein
VCCAASDISPPPVRNLTLLGRFGRVGGGWSGTYYNRVVIKWNINNLEVYRREKLCVFYYFSRYFHRFDGRAWVGFGGFLRLFRGLGVGGSVPHYLEV